MDEQAKSHLFILIHLFLKAKWGHHLTGDLLEASYDATNDISHKVANMAALLFIAPSAFKSINRQWKASKTQTQYRAFFWLVIQKATNLEIYLSKCTLKEMGLLQRQEAE